jgi:V8-like Glu-specific endopeptidase
MLHRSKLVSVLLALLLSDVALGCLKTVDNRKQIATTSTTLPPHKFIPKIVFQWIGYPEIQTCSGTLMNRMGPPGTRVILTAAHCMVLPGKLTSIVPDQANVQFPGMTEAQLTTQDCVFTISPGYQNTGDSYGDWALITCKQQGQVTDSTFPHGGFGWRADFTTYSPSWSFPLAFSAGWPLDKDASASQQWQTTGALASQTPSGGNARWSLGDMSIWQGQDGAPVWVYDTMGHPQVVGVVSNVVSSTGCQNYGTVLTPDTIALLHAALWDSLNALGEGYSGVSLQPATNNDYLTYDTVTNAAVFAPAGTAERLFLLIKMVEYYSEQDISAPNQFTAKCALKSRSTGGWWLYMDVTAGFPCSYSGTNIFPTGCGFLLTDREYGIGSAFVIRDFRNVPGSSDIGLLYDLIPVPAFLSELPQPYIRPHGQITSSIGVHTTMRFTEAVPY